MKTYAVVFGLLCCLFCLLYSHYKLEDRLDQVEQQVADQQVEQQRQNMPGQIVIGRWVGVGRLDEPRRNAALYLQYGRDPIIQIMDGQYNLANFAITVQNGTVIMQLIQDGKVRHKKLWDLTDESDFIRNVRRHEMTEVDDENCD